MKIVPKCKLDNQISMQLHGKKYEVDPCIYEEVERHENVTVIIHKCKNCGHIDISWEKQDNTESIYP